MLNVDGDIYIVYGNSGYDPRWFMKVLLQSANLTELQKKLNIAIYRVGMTVE